MRILFSFPDLSRHQNISIKSIASKEDLAKCARLLAINVAHYKLVYGTLPLDEAIRNGLRRGTKSSKNRFNE